MPLERLLPEATTTTRAHHAGAVHGMACIPSYGRFARTTTDIWLSAHPPTDTRPTSGTAQYLSESRPDRRPCGRRWRWPAARPQRAGQLRWGHALARSATLTTDAEALGPVVPAVLARPSSSPPRARPGRATRPPATVDRTSELDQSRNRPDRLEIADEKGIVVDLRQDERRR